MISRMVDFPAAVESINIVRWNGKQSEALYYKDSELFLTCTPSSRLLVTCERLVSVLGQLHNETELRQNGQCLLNIYYDTNIDTFHMTCTHPQIERDITS